MRVVTSANYIAPSECSGEEGWYYFIGCFEWTKMPKSKMKDAASVFVKNIAWSKEESDYAANIYCIDENQEITCKKIESVSLYDNGFSFEFDIPQQSDAKKMIVYLYGKGRVSQYTQPYSFNVSSHYEHVSSLLGVQPEFSWNDKIGIVMEECKYADHTVYHSMGAVNYEVD